MTMAISPERAERRRAQKELADQLKASGALDDIFAKIDAGEPLTGEGGLLGSMLKATLERGLDVELTDHLGYERGDATASLFDNSRNGTSSKTVATEIGDIELAVPRDRHGTFTPMLVAKGQRRLDGIDGMIISLYAGGMTIRDIQHHLASTLGTELSHETISKITDQIAEIARSSREQATGLNQVNTAVNQMDHVTQQNAAMVEEATAAATNLRGEANELTHLVGRFQIDGVARPVSRARAA